MAHRYQARQRTAQLLRRDLRLSKLAKQNDASIAEALRLTLEDETIFERLFGEPMPTQLRAALHAEHQLWTQTQNHPNNDPQTIRRLNNIQKLLSLQQQMLHTPLTHKFQQAIERILRER